MHGLSRRLTQFQFNPSPSRDLSVSLQLAMFIEECRAIFLFKKIDALKSVKLSFTDEVMMWAAAVTVIICHSAFSLFSQTPAAINNLSSVSVNHQLAWFLY